MKYAWVVQQWRDDGPADMQGVFSSKEKAVAACRMDTFCVSRYTVDEEAPVETLNHPYCWYPLREEEPVLA